MTDFAPSDAAADAATPASPSSPLPRSIGAPATRALNAAGHPTLESLNGVPLADVRKLHGIGPKALRILAEQMRQRGLSFS